jgi:undecaprenyl-diphosphatase
VDLLKAIFLGTLQGLSEFLPISSSGHLVIAEHLLSFQEGGLAFEVFVHFGTLLAVVVVFRKDIVKMIIAFPSIFRRHTDNLSEDIREYAKLDIYIIIGSIPAGIVGVVFKDRIEQLFESHYLALAMLFVTGIIMWSSRYTREDREHMNMFHAFLIGVAQAFAIIPGISRSGSTIVTGLWLGIRRDLVAKFSFILSTPAILGATLIKFNDLWETPLPSSELKSVIVASIAAGISGYFAIIWLLDVIRKQKLEWFGVYCIAVSIMGLLLFYLYNL